MLEGPFRAGSTSWIDPSEGLESPQLGRCPVFDECRLLRKAVVVSVGISLVQTLDLIGRDVHQARAIAHQLHPYRHGLGASQPSSCLENEMYQSARSAEKSEWEIG